METMSLKFSRIGLFLAAAMLATPRIYAGQYFQDFHAFAVGATNFNDGSQLFSTDLGTLVGVQAGGNLLELGLTEVNSNNVQSAFELPDLDSGAPIYAFSAKWNSQVYGNFPAAGNGYSFNFGPLSPLNLITNNAEESGYGAGLCFSVRTCSGTNSGFYLCANGCVIASLTNNTATEWGTNNTTRHFWEVDWNYYTGMTVRLDCQTIFTNVVTPGFTPEGGDVFVWGARCSTNTEEVRLDNIVIVTGGNLVQLPTSNPYFTDLNLPIETGYPITNAFDGNNNTFWFSSGSSGFAGATLSSPNKVLAYALTSGEEGKYAPESWTFEGSTNSGTNWIACGSGNGYFLNAAETRGWLATNSTSFNAYEINFTSNGITGMGEVPPPGTGTMIGELRFYALSIVGAPYTAWTQSSAPGESWYCIASSSDGTKLAAVINQENGGGIYVSTNSGNTWKQTSAPNENWNSIASSSDGTKLAACAPGISAGIYVSTNSGSTWVRTGAPSEPWHCIASSSDGTKLAAAWGNEDGVGGIYVSTNSGSTWIQTSAPGAFWQSIASTSDGTKLAAGAYPNEGQTNYGGIYVSTNSGNTWTQTSAPNEEWISIASSANGTNLAAAEYGGGIYVSTNSGSTWMQTSAYSEYWNSIASSSDGTKLAAAAWNYAIFVSTNSGSTWARTGPLDVAWNSIASSSDGTKLAAEVLDGGIYTYSFATPPAPSLNATLFSGYAAFSWTTTNGGNFVLQQNTNLLSTNWLNITSPVTLSGRQYQVVTPNSGGNNFYRLSTQ